MGIWEDHARRVQDALGPALNKTDRWGRYVAEPRESMETVVVTPLGRVSPQDRLTGRVDWKFVADREGVETSGYVPRNTDGDIDEDSGVTIAAGFDLGKRSERNLQELGLSRDLIDTLKPYLGLRGQSADSFVRQNPLKITEDQEKLISSLVFQQTYDDIARRYNADGQMAFQSLPREAQTAITSLALQYGTNLAQATPNYWRQVTSEAWPEAYKNLRKFGDDYQPRRDLEAELLKQAMDAGKLSRPQPRLLNEPPFDLDFDPAITDF